MEDLAMNPEFWNGRRVFITGHTGFKGGWLSLWLQQLGAELTGYALAPPSVPSLFEEARVASGMTSVIGDICDLQNLSQAMQQARPEVIIHMAAQPLVRYSYDNPLETYRTNVLGTATVAEAARSVKGLRAIVNITTDKCYENKEWVWAYRENDALGGYDPYSNSKACAELVTASYRSSFFNPANYDQHGVAIASARAGNVIGGGDWASDRLIPDIIAALELSKPVLIRNPGAIRPWQHVLEPLSGYLTLAERLCLEGPVFGSAWNFGPVEGDARPVSWVVEKIANLLGSGAQWQIDEGNHLHEASSLKLDISLADRRLNWRPAMNLEQAIGLVVDWVLARQAKADLRKLTLNQIGHYQELALR
jgi:CDP-glucose 4,6-dehydratase